MSDVRRRALDVIAPVFPPPQVAGLYEWASGLILANSESPALGSSVRSPDFDPETLSTLTHEFAHLAQGVMSAPLLQWQSHLFGVLLRRLASAAPGPVDETFAFQLHDVLRSFRPDPERSDDDALVLDLLHKIYRRDQVGLAPLDLLEAHATWIEYRSHWSTAEQGPHYWRWLESRDLEWDRRGAFDLVRFLLGDALAEKSFATLVGTALTHGEPGRALLQGTRSAAGLGVWATAEQVLAALVRDGIGPQDPRDALSSLGGQAHPALALRTAQLRADSLEQWILAPEGFLAKGLALLDPVVAWLPEARGRIPVLRPAKSSGWTTQSEDDVAGGLVETQMIAAAALHQYGAYLQPEGARADLAWLADVSPTAGILHLSEGMDTTKVVDRLRELDNGPVPARWYGRLAAVFDTPGDSRPDALIPWVRNTAHELLDRCPWLPLYLSFAPGCGESQLMLWLGVLTSPMRILPDGQMNLTDEDTMSGAVWLARQALSAGRERQQDASPQVRSILNILPAAFEPYFWKEFHRSRPPAT